MKIGIIGSGNVGQALASGFLASGHTVKIGTRDSKKLAEFITQAGKKASIGSFEECAKFGDLIVICTLWLGTENAIQMANPKNFKGKTVIDVTNPLLFEKQGPPNFALAYPNSAGRRIQEILKDANVVKAFNSVPAHLMVNPKFKEGMPTMPIAGNSVKAKKEVSKILSDWGWEVLDLGDISKAYMCEAFAMVVIYNGILNNDWMRAFKFLKL